MIWPFRPRAWLPPCDTGPSSFGDDWAASEIDYVSAAIRSRGQPESEGFRRKARVALNTLRGGSAVELVARAMEESSNPGSDADAPIPPRTGHYMMGMPRWCAWVEYARPAVAEIINRGRKAGGKMTNIERLMLENQLILLRNLYEGSRPDLKQRLSNDILDQIKSTQTALANEQEK